MGDDTTIRLISPQDSLAALTDLLHRAYAPLAAEGMHFLASQQSEEGARHRIRKGECYLALHRGTIVGTLHWCAPGQSKGTPWFERPDVATFHQYAVDPTWQRRGLGCRLLALAEERTAAAGAAELALDTAEPASALIAFYHRRGFRFIENIKWNSVNYRSVVLSKAITPLAAAPVTPATPPARLRNTSAQSSPPPA